MTSSVTSALILSTLTTFGGAILVIVTAVIGIGVAYLIFTWGYQQILGIGHTDKPRFWKGERWGKSGSNNW
jgi:hypothetical protein